MRARHSWIRLRVGGGLTAPLPFVYCLRMAGPDRSFLFGLSVCFRTQVSTALCLRLVFLDLERMLEHCRIRADAGDLPRHFHERRARLDREVVVLDLARHDGLREGTDDREL